MLRDIIFDSVLVVVGSMGVLFLFVALPGLVWEFLRQRRKRARPKEEDAPCPPA